MAKNLVHQHCNVSISFPTTTRNISSVQHMADKYNSCSYGFLGNTGMCFSFSAERRARGFIRDLRGLEYIENIELARQRYEKIPIRPVKKR